MSSIPGLTSKFKEADRVIASKPAFVVGRLAIHHGDRFCAEKVHSLSISLADKSILLDVLVETSMRQTTITVSAKPIQV